MLPENTTAPTGRTTIDGIPVVWESLPVDPEARLVFAAGHRDEHVTQVGITEVVVEFVKQHLAALGLKDFSFVVDDMTRFISMGTHAERTRHLAGVCEALALVREIDDETLTTLKAGYSSRVHSTPTMLLLGTEDLGHGGLADARMHDWTAAEVREHATRHFHAGAATLVLAEPPWDGIQLPLPAGPAPSRRVPTVRVSQRTVMTAASEFELVCVTGHGHRPSASALALEVLTQALIAPLDELGGKPAEYDWVLSHATPLGDGDLWEFDVVLPDGSRAEALRRTVAVLDRLTTTGPSPDELDAGMRTAVSNQEDPYVQIDALETVAVLEACGTPRDLVTAATVAAVTADEVHAVLRDVNRSLVLNVPAVKERDTLLGLVRDAGWTQHDATDDPSGRSAEEILATTFARTTHPGPGAPEIFSDRRWRPHRGRRVAVLPDRLVLAEGTSVQTFLLAELVLVGTSADGEVELVTSRGGIAALEPALFRGLPKALDRALAYATRALRYDKTRRAVRTSWGGYA